LKSGISIKVEDLTLLGRSLDLWNKNSAILLLIYYAIRNTVPNIKVLQALGIISGSAKLPSPHLPWIIKSPSYCGHCVRQNPKARRTQEREKRFAIQGLMCRIQPYYGCGCWLWI